MPQITYRRPLAVRRGALAMAPAHGFRGVPPVVEPLDAEPLDQEADMRRQPDHGMDSVPAIVAWWSDGDDSRYSEY